MNPKSEIKFAQSKQERSQKTLEDILQAASSLVDDANPELFTSRSLAQKSGYALGTLVRRLSSVENVFLWAIKQARETKFKELALEITQFDTNESIQDFAESMVTKGFTVIQKVNPKVMRFFEARITKRDGLTADYFSYFDCLVAPYLEAAQKNKTNTFRQMTKEEASLLIKQLCLLIERPFMENRPIAGTQEHHRISKDAIIRLLGKVIY
jgi:hypothetical protein